MLQEHAIICGRNPCPHHLNGCAFVGNREKVKENITNEKFLYRIPGHVSICCKNIEGESLVLQADLRGVAISSGSACSSKDTVNHAFIKPSHVLQACEIPKDYIKGSLRITLGKDNTKEDIEYIKETIKTITENKKSLALK